MGCHSRLAVKSHRLGRLGAGSVELRVQTQQVFDLSDASGNKLEGYNTVDFIGSYALPVGKLTFSIENLLNEDYVTIWGQRARCSTARPTAVHCMNTKVVAVPLA
jgi:outer membrane receptor protein involved in Fe transport